MAPKHKKNTRSKTKRKHSTQDEEPVQYARVIQAIRDMKRRHGCTLGEIMEHLLHQSSKKTKTSDRDTGSSRPVRLALRFAMQKGVLVRNDGRYKICSSPKSVPAKRERSRQNKNRKGDKRKRSPTTSQSREEETDSTSKSGSTTDGSDSYDKNERKTRGRNRRTRRGRETKQKRKPKESRKSSCSSTNRSRSEQKKKEPTPEKSRPDEDENNQQQQQQENDDVLPGTSYSTSRRLRRTHNTHRGWRHHQMDETHVCENPQCLCKLKQEPLQPTQPLEPTEPPERSPDQEQTPENPEEKVCDYIN